MKFHGGTSTTAIVNCTVKIEVRTFGKLRYLISLFIKIIQKSLYLVQIHYLYFKIIKWKRLMIFFFQS